MILGLGGQCTRKYSNFDEGWLLNTKTQFKKKAIQIVLTKSRGWLIKSGKGDIK
jgi:hypothetical protein